MLTYLIIWQGIHRTALFGAAAVGLWVGAYTYYLKNDIRTTSRTGVPIAGAWTWQRNP